MIEVFPWCIWVLKVGQGNRMFDPSSHKVVITRDVHFEEDKKWDWSQYNHNSDGISTSWTDFVVQDDVVQVTQPVLDQPSQPTDFEQGSSGEGGGASTSNPNQSSHGLRRTSMSEVIPSKLKYFVVEESLRQAAEVQEECVHVRVVTGPRWCSFELQRSCR